MADAFDQMFPRRSPMTADQARAVIAEMRADTPRLAMRQLLKMALGPAGNLSDEARAVYRAELLRIS